MPVWEDDLPEEIMERLAGILCEFGILVRESGSHLDGEFLVKEYQFDSDDTLPQPALLEI